MPDPIILAHTAFGSYTVYNILVYEQIHKGNINFQFRDGTVWDMTEDWLIMR